MEIGRVSAGVGVSDVDLAEIERILGEIYRSDRMTTFTTIELIRGRSSTSLADAASVYLIDGTYILLVSPPSFVDAVADQAAAMEAMRARLAPGAAGVILPIVAQGRFGERSYLMVPRCDPLRTGPVAGRLDRLRLTRPTLNWLRGLATNADPATPASVAEFRRGYVALAAMPELPAALLNDANQLIGLIDAGELSPGHVPMHGDIWQGNIVRQPGGQLALIDWGGSTTQGYGVYDLIRFAQSFRLRKSSVRAELLWHAEALDLGPAGLKAHLLGALGHFVSRLGECPRERFVRMATDCHATLLHAL